MTSSKKYKVTIRWGRNPEPDSDVTYKFNTYAELCAFLQGVEEGCGWMDYETIERDE